jgi:hypothetical protein
LFTLIAAANGSKANGSGDRKDAGCSFAADFPQTAPLASTYKA